MAQYRTKCTVEVRQAPSRTSSLFHHLPAGRLVRQLGTKILYSEGIARMSIQPRGWIDEESVERVTGSAGAVAAVPSPAKAAPPTRPAKASEDIPPPPGFEAGTDTPATREAAASEKPAAKHEEVAEKVATASRSTEWSSADAWQENASWESRGKWESKDGSSWKACQGWNDSNKTWSEDSGRTWSETGKPGVHQKDGEARPTEVQSEAEVKSMLGDGRSLTRGRTPISTPAQEESRVHSEAQVKNLLGDGRSLTRGRPAGRQAEPKAAAPEVPAPKPAPPTPTAWELAASRSEGRGGIARSSTPPPSSRASPSVDGSFSTSPSGISGREEDLWVAL